MDVRLMLDKDEGKAARVEGRGKMAGWVIPPDDTGGYLLKKRIPLRDLFPTALFAFLPGHLLPSARRAWFVCSCEIAQLLIDLPSLPSQPVCFLILVLLVVFP